MAQRVVIPGFRKIETGGNDVVCKGVIVSSITPIEGGNRVTFQYTLDDGTIKTSTMDVMNGADGKEPSITIGANNNWFVNGIDTGVKAKGEKGDPGSGFNTTRQYSSVSDMMTDTSPANDSEIVVVILGNIGNFYMRLSSYVDPEGITNGYLPIGSAQDISTIKGEPGKDGTDGITPHIDSDTKHWFLGLTDTGVTAEGKNGITPSIGSNNHWFIGSIDTGVLAKGQDGKDGRSITSITKDDNDNIIVTFSDNTTQTIGKLSVDIQGDFLTSGGFGNLRYYNGHFQYYNNITSTWIDTSVTPSNVYIMNMTPQEMKKIFAVYDTVLGKYKLKFEEPDDTVIDGQVACIVEKVVIRRKLGSVPTSETDGDLVLEIKRKDFGTYKNEYFVDTALSPSADEIFYYKAFPMSTTGFYNSNSANETEGIKCKDYNLYGFKINQNESDPSSMITYIEDNKSFESVHMDYNTDTFNYGDWGDTWFIKNLKPCMLKYDGTVDYELDKNDHTKKFDSTDSDVANDSYGGNAMVGIPKVYWKIVDNGDDTANIYFSDKKVDENFHCYSHIDNNGNEIDYCYMPIYNGSEDSNNKLRSLSGKTPMTSQTGQTEIAYAKENNLTSNEIWNTELYSDRILITLLLLLIGKSTDTQTVFGTGNESGSLLSTGTMNKNGLFYGSKSSSQGVKVFGIENFWGNLWRRTAGYIYTNNTQKVKMTYGKQDGSTYIDYNTTGEGYLEIPNSQISGSSGGYINVMLFNKHGLFPKQISGSSSTFYTDGCWFESNTYALFGGSYGSKALVGALFVDLRTSVSGGYTNVGCAVSCKPLVKS